MQRQFKMAAALNEAKGIPPNPGMPQALAPAQIPAPTLSVPIQAPSNSSASAFKTDFAMNSNHSHPLTLNGQFNQ